MYFRSVTVNVLYETVCCFTCGLCNWTWGEWNNILPNVILARNLTPSVELIQPIWNTVWTDDNIGQVDFHPQKDSEVNQANQQLQHIVTLTTLVVSQWYELIYTATIIRVYTKDPFHCVAITGWLIAPFYLSSLTIFYSIYLTERSQEGWHCLKNEITSLQGSALK